MSERDDLFLDALENDEPVAWRLAEAAARPAPPGLREAIVGPHRRRVGPGPLERLRPLAPRIALAALAVLLVPVLSTLATTRSDLERERGVASEYERALAAVATGGRLVALVPGPAAAGRGSLVIAPSGEAYLVLAMPAPPAGKSYEAWIVRDGLPLPAGLAPTRGGVVIIALSSPPRAGDVAAVTLEAATGAQRPTSDPLLVGKL